MGAELELKWSPRSARAQDESEAEVAVAGAFVATVERSHHWPGWCVTVTVGGYLIGARYDGRLDLPGAKRAAAEILLGLLVPLLDGGALQLAEQPQPSPIGTASVAPWRSLATALRAEVATHRALLSTLAQVINPAPTSLPELRAVSPSERLRMLDTLLRHHAETLRDQMGRSDELLAEREVPVTTSAREVLR